MNIRPVSTVLLEALTIGVILQLLFWAITKYLYNGVGVLIIVGALIHVLFEFSPFGNINEKWCKVIFK